ncbi:metal ABC transporter substrate-binding protein [Tateyamaria sp. SN6-1]|uniref:metal ABC transporter substrate-binding protein n=1 Tax=Tateyamaria sp. SN6-1 TaxID=3092148 RepID=UPI0039F5242C
MRKLSWTHIGARLCALALALICATAATAEEKPRVVTVNQALHDLAERLSDGAADIVFPVPQGVDPSFWRPAIADISMIQSADLILLNGAGFATWIDRVSLPRSRIVNTSAAITDRFIVTQSITHSHGDGGEHSHEGVASYTWLDPTLAIAQAEAIAAAFIARDLAPAEAVEAQLAALRADLTALDTTARDALNGLAGTSIIATHPRYQYFAARYGLTISSLEWEAGAMPTDAQFAELKRLSEEQNAQILIWEAQPPAEALAAVERLGLQSVIFEPGAVQGSLGTFIEAYAQAVSDLSDAARLTSN